MKAREKPKRTAKQLRQHEVLIGLVDLFITTGKPVGSHALQEHGFKNLSSATLRNYFSELEANNYLIQEHSSAGRIPTSAAFRLYAFEKLDQLVSGTKKNPLFETKAPESQEQQALALYLQNAAEELSKRCDCPVFLSSPRFDQDYVNDIKLVPIDSQRCLCVLVTTFGVIQTVTLQTPKMIHSLEAKRLESYFQWRLNGLDKPETLTESEEKLAQELYNEAMVRHIVNYSNFLEEDIYRTGFSRLLGYPEFRDPTSLTKSLTLFESAHSMRLLLRDCCGHEAARVWIGEDLLPFVQQTPECTVISFPYSINYQVVGAIGILGPMRLPYAHIFSTLQACAEELSSTLTASLYKYKITFRQPENNPFLTQDKTRLIQFETDKLFLEDQRANLDKSITHEGDPRDV